MNSIKLDTGLKKRIFQLSIPIIMQQLFTQLLIWADTAMLGHYDSDLFTALGNVITPYELISSAVYALCGGTTILVAQKIGAKDYNSARKYAECSFLGNSLFSVIAFSILFFGANFIFDLMGVPDSIVTYTLGYIRIVSFIILFMGLSGTCVSILQGVGITKIIMYSGIFSNLLNILLDWLLIYGIGPFPELGMEGAAFATVISNLSAIPIVLAYVIKSKKIPFKMSLKNTFSVNFKSYKDVLIYGVPSGLEYMLWNVGVLFMVAFLNHSSDYAAGIYNLVLSIEVFPLMIYMGFSSAGLTLVGQKTGEKNHDEAIRIGLNCLIYAFVTCIVIGLLFIFAPRPILTLFTDDISYVELSAPYLQFIAIILLPKAINNVVGPSIRGFGDTKWMLYTQVFGTVLTIACSYVFIMVLNMDVFGAFLTFFFDELIRGVVNYLRFTRGREFFKLKPFENKV